MGPYLSARLCKDFGGMVPIPSWWRLPMKGMVGGPGGRLDLLIFLDLFIKRSFINRAMKMNTKRKNGV